MLNPWLQQLLTSAVAVAAINGLFLWWGQHWIKSRFDRALEDYRFELKTHEQAAKIAEYAALAINLEADEGKETYRRANQLAWELFLWLPDEVYRRLGRGLSRSDFTELTDALVDVRKLLLKDAAGNLDGNHLISHGPGLAAKNVAPNKIKPDK